VRERRSVSLATEALALARRDRAFLSKKTISAGSRQEGGPQAHALILGVSTMAAMDTSSNVIDLAAWRAERLSRPPSVSRDKAPKPRVSAGALEDRQRETIEKLRALGYEMCHERRGAG
jgi:hypothetical protein